MKASIKAILEAATTFSSGLSSETQFIDKVTEATQNIDWDEYEAVKKEEHKQGVVNMALMCLERNAPGTSKEWQKETSVQIEAAIEWLHDNGYLCSFDDGMTFHVTEEEGMPAFVMYNHNPIIFIEAFNSIKERDSAMHKE